MQRYSIPAVCVSLCIVLTATVIGAKPTTTSPLACLSPVPFTSVTIHDQFWAPRQEINRTVSIPHSLKMLEEAGNLHDLDLAAAGSRSDYKGPVFIDSDLYKAIEAASYSLASHPDAELQNRVDAIIAKIAAAQLPDGYLNTWYEVNAPDQQFTNLRDNHELYCAGHLFEAAAAHYAATRQRSLLDVATRYADLLANTFGDSPGKRPGYCGHPEIELALFKLATAAGQPRYAALSRFFLNTRGSKFFATEHKEDPAKYDGGYWQDNCPIRDHERVTGHAVRMMYLMSAAADLAAQTRDPALVQMLERVWRNTTERNMYITGGIGSSAKNEGFTQDYDLPNETAYQETCASVGMIMWNYRLALLHGDAKYADVMERALYNGFLAGVSLDGTRYFYVNPLASKGDHHRQQWYGCACCPPNVTRTLAQLGGYAYATAGTALYVNLYIDSTAKIKIADQDVTISVQTKYPWDGTIRVRPEVSQPMALELHCRVPGWCANTTVTLNGSPLEKPQIESGYLVVNRTWKPSDEVQLTFDMLPVQVTAHPAVAEDVGKLAVQRGPLVYCAEQADQPTSLSLVALPPSSRLEQQWSPNLLGGIIALNTTGQVSQAKGDAQLYSPATKSKSVPLTLVPYYAWDNRAPGAMRVWLPATPPG